MWVLWDLTSRPNHRDHRDSGTSQQGWNPTHCPKRPAALWQQKLVFSQTLLCSGEAKLSPWWLSPIDILWSPSITFTCWWVSWEVFLFHDICIFCNWFVMCFDVYCSASMLHRIQCAMSKADEISKQKLLLKLMLHPQDSALFNYKATQRSSAQLCSWWKSLFGEAEI